MTSATRSASLDTALRSISGNPNEFIVEWYRADRFREICRIFLAGAILVVIGSIISGFAFSQYETGQPLFWSMFFLCLGGCFVLSGPLSTVIRLRLLLDEELYIALCSDGVAFCNDHKIDFMSWDILMSASYDNQNHALLIERREEEPLQIKGSFQDVSSPEIASRINTIRTKALWNTLATEFQ